MSVRVTHHSKLTVKVLIPNKAHHELIMSTSLKVTLTNIDKEETDIVVIGSCDVTFANVTDNLNIVLSGDKPLQFNKGFCVA